MFLAGPAGTGKSRVINALKDFFIEREQERRFRVSSFMGIAARNIGGMTLHAALSIGKVGLNQANSKAARDLVAMWEGVDYLFIDEISMVSCKLLCQVSEALTIAKGNTDAFGGINIIFVGDFAQLPPVAETRLYARVNTKGAGAGTSRGQKVIFGKLLWLSIKTVVILSKQHKQVGPDNTGFVHLLGRLREGRCNMDDFHLLSTRLLKNDIVDFTTEGWRNAPIIVSDNATKDTLNERAAAAFAHSTNQELRWYYAEDRRCRKLLTDPALRALLGRMHSRQTKGRLQKIPLVIGMPALVSQNFDVEGGIVNGSRGTVACLHTNWTN